MEYEGVLTKMETELAKPISYYMVFENGFLNVNQLLGKEFEIDWLGYQCLNCSKKKKIIRHGFCWDCFSTSAATGEWIIRPELSKAHLGIADRDLAYETQAQVQPHIVYLALCSDVKVGVTRKSQIPTRWIDQGACAAIPLLDVPNRYLAGITEVALKNHYTDKTNWKKMLLNDITQADLIAERKRAEAHFPEEVRPYYDSALVDVVELEYPTLAQPEKVAGLNLEKERSYRGRLVGIRGQYLIFEDGKVFNVRSNEGLTVRISI